MLDYLLYGTAGLTVVNTAGEIALAVSQHKTKKRVAELEESKNFASSAYATAKDAEATAIKASQHADWIHAELDKSKLLPEKPKSPAEISAEYMKAMTSMMEGIANSYKPADNKPSGGISDTQMKQFTDAITAAIAGAVNQGK